eukprot:1874336-Rhodomonas_salina.2
MCVQLRARLRFPQGSHARHALNSQRLDLLGRSRNNRQRRGSGAARAQWEASLSGELPSSGRTESRQEIPPAVVWGVSAAFALPLVAGQRHTGQPRAEQPRTRTVTHTLSSHTRSTATQPEEPHTHCRATYTEEPFALKSHSEEPL